MTASRREDLDERGKEKSGGWGGAIRGSHPFLLVANGKCRARKNMISIAANLNDVFASQ